MEQGGETRLVFNHDSIGIHINRNCSRFLSGAVMNRKIYFLLLLAFSPFGLAQTYPGTDLYIVNPGPDEDHYVGFCTNAYDPSDPDCHQETMDEATQDGLDHQYQDYLQGIYWDLDPVHSEAVGCDPEDPFCQSGYNYFYRLFAAHCPEGQEVWGANPSFCVPDYGSGNGVLHCPTAYAPYAGTCYPDITYSECEAYAASANSTQFGLVIYPAVDGNNPPASYCDVALNEDTGGGGDGSFDDSNIVSGLSDVENSVNSVTAAVQNADSNNVSELQDVNAELDNISSLLDDSLDLATAAPDCSAPPSCSGDAIQCAMLEQSWYVMCNSSDSQDQGVESLQFDCSSGFLCTGDPYECAVLQTHYNNNCASFDSSDQSTLAGLLSGIGLESVDDVLADAQANDGYVFDETVDLTQFDWTGITVNTTQACPNAPSIDMGTLGTVTVPFDALCTILRWVGYFVRISASLVAFTMTFTAVRNDI